MSADDSDESPAPKKRPLWPIFPLLGLLAVAMGTQHYVLGVPVDKVLSDVGLIFAAFAGGLSVFFVGALLYFIRCRWLYYYGMGEVAVGFLGAIYVIAQIMGEVDGRLAIWLALAAALYVVVRGLDNVHKSLNSKDRKEWERFFFGRRPTA